MPSEQLRTSVQFPSVSAEKVGEQELNSSNLNGGYWFNEPAIVLCIFASHACRDANTGYLKIYLFIFLQKKRKIKRNLQFWFPLESEEL